MAKIADDRTMRILSAVKNLNRVGPTGKDDNPPSDAVKAEYIRVGTLLISLSDSKNSDKDIKILYEMAATCPDEDLMIESIHEWRTALRENSTQPIFGKPVRV